MWINLFEYIHTAINQISKKKIDLHSDGKSLKIALGMNIQHLRKETGKSCFSKE